MLYYFKKILCYLNYTFSENKSYKIDNKTNYKFNNNKILPYKIDVDQIKLKKK